MEQRAAHFLLKTKSMLTIHVHAPPWRSKLPSICVLGILHEYAASKAILALKVGHSRRHVRYAVRVPSVPEVEKHVLLCMSSCYHLSEAAFLFQNSLTELPLA